MTTTLFEEIIAFVFGRKYYANIIATKGVERQEICSYIFTSISQAEKHRMEIETTLSFTFVETVSFRSRKRYVYLVNNGSILL
ncbi:MAG: hypothetical protein ACI358_01525 [Candidatus Limimorpha sp.]